ncbi:MAG: TlpA family protein disulfide reductase [Flavisolibacter sp.]
MRLACLLLFLTLIGFAPPNASAQDTPAAIKPLTIGDTVPDVVLENIINYSSPEARVSDFNGKVLLLDFWASWCGPCLKKLPGLDALQRKHAANLQVLLVSRKSSIDTYERLCTFFETKRTPSGENYILPDVVGDATLGQLFPHKSIPYMVVIDTAGTVKAFLSGDDLTLERIQSFLPATANR